MSFPIMAGKNWKYFLEKWFVLGIDVKILSGTIWTVTSKSNADAFLALT